MNSQPSVLAKARTMTAEATRLRQDADAEHDASRVIERVNELLPLVDQLGKIARAARSMREVSPSDRIDLSGLDDGRAAFARHAGLPSNQAFTAAKTRINSVLTRVKAELGQAWSGWTGRRQAELQLTHIPLLDVDDQGKAREWREELQRLAKVTVPSRTDISVFQSTAGLLAEILATVSDPPKEVVDLLRRLGERPPLTLADLSDDDIRRLREVGIDGQIEVRRRGS